LDEGFVGVDFSEKKNGSYPRIKMKNPRYLAVGKLICAGEGSFDGKKALRVCLAGEVDEICEYFPEFADAIFAIKKEMGLICDEIDKVYSEIKHLAESDGTPDGIREGKKNFAQAAKNCKYTAALFAILAGKTSQRTGKVFTCGNDYIYSMSLVNLAQLMGVKGD